MLYFLAEADKNIEGYDIFVCIILRSLHYDIIDKTLELERTTLLSYTLFYVKTKKIFSPSLFHSICACSCVFFMVKTLSQQSLGDLRERMATYKGY